MLPSYTFAICAMVLWGIAPLFAKAGLTKLEPVAALTVRSTVITVVLLMFMLVSGKWNQMTATAPRDIAFIALEGICAALVGQLAYYYAIKYGEVSQVAPVVAAFPLVALVGGILVLGENITLLKAVGAVMVIAGLVIMKLSG
ncbi:hypothetical protein SCACP_40140 [Sporomusa carbonis]|uniref:EamA family transporter n=1 Tax=Sporomusa carbonis TaxID=3076075 RepID=UPI003A7527BA